MLDFPISIFPSPQPLQGCDASRRFPEKIVGTVAVGVCPAATGAAVGAASFWHTTDESEAKERKKKKSSLILSIGKEIRCIECKVNGQQCGNACVEDSTKAAMSGRHPPSSSEFGGVLRWGSRKRSSYDSTGSTPCEKFAPLVNDDSGFRIHKTHDK
jgi:hypothetical protein